MAINSTIFKIDLQIADLDRNYYQNHTLTVARHPSETDERMMMRVLAFASHAQEGLVFGKGLSTENEPDLWVKNLAGEIELWIDVGQPDEKRIRRAAGRAQHTVIYSYGGNDVDIWWKQNQRRLSQMSHLVIYRITTQLAQNLAALVKRTMQLQCTIQDGEIMFVDGHDSVQATPQVLKPD